MIIIINGSIGVGKTSVSWALNQQLDQSVMLDGDYLGAVHPFEIYDKKRTAYLYRTLAHLIQFHLENGYQDFIINYVFEQAEELQRLLDALAPLNQNIHCFWLSCTLEEQQERIRKRNNDQMPWELERAVELSGILHAASQTGFIGRKVETMDKNCEQIANEILSVAATSSIK